jgi:uncharacterized protein (TIGR03382 family)
MSTYHTLSSLSVVGAVLATLLLATPSWASPGGDGPTLGEPEFSRGGHTVQENIWDPKPPSGSENLDPPDPPDPPAPPPGWILIDPPLGSDGWELEGQLMGPIDLPMLPTWGPFRPHDLPNPLAAVPQQGQMTFSAPISPIPAPGAAALLGMGVLALMGRRRRMG